MKSLLQLGLVALSVACGSFDVTMTPSIANATVLPSGGTTNQSDLPAMASAKVRSLYPGWSIVNSTLRPGGRTVTVQARNPRNVAGTFNCAVITRIERGTTVYYIGDVTGPL